MFKIHKEAGSVYKAIFPRQLCGGLFLLGEESLAVFPVYFTGKAVDEFKNGTMTSGSLARFVLIIIGIALLCYIFASLFMVFIHNSGNRAGYLFRRNMMCSLLKKTPFFFSRFSSGDILARASNDITVMESYFGYGFILLVDSFVYPIICIAGMSVLISWKLTFAVILPFPLITILYACTGKKMQRLSTKTFEAFGNVNQEILELVEGIKLIRCFVNEQVRLQKLSGVVKYYFSALYAKAVFASLLQPFTTFIANLSTIIAFCYGGYLVHIGEITAGNLFSFFMFAGIFTWSWMASSFYIQLYRDAAAAIQRINEFLSPQDEFPASAFDIHDKAAPAASAASALVSPIQTIELKDFSFNYDDTETPVLKHISLALTRGKTLGIAGKTGSGKTSLIKQLLCLYPNCEGMYCNGIPAAHIDRAAFLAETGYAAQSPELFSGTIADNVCFFAKNISEEAVNTALQKAEIYDEVSAFQKGIYTEIGEKGLTLSGGQRQRIALARALLADPELLILDDAVSAVDADTEQRIITTIKKERAGKTTVISAHRLSAVSHADSILVLDGGCIAEQGTHSELMEAGGWYAEQYRLQQNSAAAHTRPVR